jgi:hypothetical protein
VKQRLELKNHFRESKKIQRIERKNRHQVVARRNIENPTCYIKRKSEASFRKTEKHIDLFEAPQSQRWRDKEY